MPSPGVIMTFDFLTPKSNQHIYEPKYIQDKNWVKSPSLFLRYGVNNVLGTHKLTDSLTDGPTRNSMPDTEGFRWRRHKGSMKTCRVIGQTLGLRRKHTNRRVPTTGVRYCTVAQKKSDNYVKLHNTRIFYQFAFDTAGVARYGHRIDPGYYQAHLSCHTGQQGNSIPVRDGPNVRL